VTSKDAAVTFACPECGSPVREVGIKTVKHVLHYELARGLRPGRFVYCANPDCDVIYLRVASDETEAFEEIFRRSDLKERVRSVAVGRDRLVCHCFGYTVGDIEDDAREGPDLIPAAIAAEVSAGLCACEVMNPKGG
jgi:hypothetical protein